MSTLNGGSAPKGAFLLSSVANSLVQSDQTILGPAVLRLFLTLDYLSYKLLQSY